MLVIIALLLAALLSVLVLGGVEIAAQAKTISTKADTFSSKVDTLNQNLQDLNSKSLSL